MRRHFAVKGLAHNQKGAGDDHHALEDGAKRAKFCRPQGWLASAGRAAKRISIRAAPALTTFAVLSSTYESTAMKRVIHQAKALKLSTKITIRILPTNVSRTGNVTGVVAMIGAVQRICGI